MRILISILLAGLAFCCSGVSARAQNNLLVVDTCGTLPLAYLPGAVRTGTQDKNGLACTGASISGGATAANQVLQIAQETAFNTALGLIADAACATDNGACSTVALIKRLNQRLTTINTTLGTPMQATGGTVGLVAGSAVIGHVIADTGSTAVVTQPTAANLNATVIGAGAAGTANAGVVTVQGIASMTKLLVTPDSVALPANQSVNVSQFNGVTPLMGNGATGTGSPRVTIASDNTAFTVNPASATVPVSTMNSASANAGVTGAVAGVFDDVAPTSIAENNFGYMRMSANRNIYSTIRDAAGNERGANIDATNQLQIGLNTTPLVSSGNGVVEAVTNEASQGTTTTSTSALAANLVVNAAATNLHSFEVSADSTLSGAAWWVMIYNATSAPTDGAVTPAKCYSMSSGTTAYAAAFPHPVRFTTGVTIGVSTTGCFIKTASTHAFISGDYK